MGLEIGSTLDRRWTLRRLVAQDAHGALYEVKHAHLDRTASLVAAPKEHRARLIREARLRDGIDHEGMLRLLDVADAADGTAYIVTRHAAGRPLDGALLARGTFAPDESVVLVLSLADTLARVHELGLAHEALSPSCVLLQEGKAVLADLGVFATPLGSVTGSLASMPYTAPERLREGRPASPVSDVYSLSALLAELLTGGAPCDWPPADLSFPIELAKVIDIGLGEAHKRYPPAAALALAMRQATAVAPLPVSKPPPPRR
ncbi:MAG: protein kinase, partial [Sandaracinaceae bacterium]|nr:protein kinase [Sandaracinaceae bacterium]